MSSSDAANLPPRTFSSLPPLPTTKTGGTPPTKHLPPPPKPLPPPPNMGANTLSTQSTPDAAKIQTLEAQILPKAASPPSTPVSTTPLSTKLRRLPVTLPTNFVEAAIDISKQTENISDLKPSTTPPKIHAAPTSSKSNSAVNKATQSTLTSTTPPMTRETNESSSPLPGLKGTFANLSSQVRTRAGTVASNASGLATKALGGSPKVDKYTAAPSTPPVPVETEPTQEKVLATTHTGRIIKKQKGPVVWIEKHPAVAQDQTLREDFRSEAAISNCLRPKALARGLPLTGLPPPQEFVENGADFHIKMQFFNGGDLENFIIKVRGVKSENAVSQAVPTSLEAKLQTSIQENEADIRLKKIAGDTIQAGLTLEQLGILQTDGKPANILVAHDDKKQCQGFMSDLGNHIDVTDPEDTAHILYNLEYTAVTTDAYCSGYDVDQLRQYKKDLSVLCYHVKPEVYENFLHAQAIKELDKDEAFKDIDQSIKKEGEKTQNDKIKLKQRLDNREINASTYEKEYLKLDKAFEKYKTDARKEIIEQKMDMLSEANERNPKFQLQPNDLPTLEKLQQKTQAIKQLGEKMAAYSTAIMLEKIFCEEIQPADGPDKPIYFGNDVQGLPLPVKTIDAKGEKIPPGTRYQYIQKKVEESTTLCPELKAFVLATAHEAADKRLNLQQAVQKSRVLEGIAAEITQRESFRNVLQRSAELLELGTATTNPQISSLIETNRKTLTALSTLPYFSPNDRELMLEVDAKLSALHASINNTSPTDEKLSRRRGTVIR